MKHILLFGAGKSASELIIYLNNLAATQFCTVTIVDAQLHLIKNKLPSDTKVRCVELDIFNNGIREKLINESDVVISLMPPNLHYIIALDCITYKKSLLTASYIDSQIENKSQEILDADVLFLYEMGLDPGIDHMSAMYLIDEIRHNGGQIKSFVSHCGGLIAPENNNNPWEYKISWNPKNVVLAGKSGAIFKLNNEVVQLPYESLFSNCKQVFINEEIGNLAYYFNRDSLQYIKAYSLETIETFIRTTLRYNAFCEGWNWVVLLQLTNENYLFDTSLLSPATFFKEHLKHFNVESIYNSIQSTSVLIQFEFLFKNDNELINKGLLSSAAILQLTIEKKLKLEKTDKDMVVMLHEIEYLKNNKLFYAKSCLVVKGTNEVYTAMSKTVGLPLGITAKLLIEGKINLKGLHIPTKKEIYVQVLNELEKNHNIFFTESTTTVS